MKKAIIPILVACLVPALAMASFSTDVSVWTSYVAGYFQANSVTIPSTFAGPVGVGTTTPVGLLSIFDTPTNANLVAFSVGSSTAAFATTTLYALLGSGQIVSGGLVPTAATSSGAGTTGAYQVSGTPTFQTVQVTTAGTAPSTNATVITVTLPSSCPTNLIPVLSPANALAANVSTSTYATSTAANTYRIAVGSTALLNSSTYIWNINSGCY